MRIHNPKLHNITHSLSLRVFIANFNIFIWYILYFYLVQLLLMSILVMSVLILMS